MSKPSCQHHSSPESGICLPTEVNVIILNSANRVRNNPSPIYRVHHNKEERSANGINKSKNKAITGDCKNTNLVDDTVIDIENIAQAGTFEIDARNRNDVDVHHEDEIKNTGSFIDRQCTGTLHSSEGNENSNDCSIGESHMEIDDQIPEGNETLNRFLDDLYEKKLDLHINFSDQEINDIREAVIKLVNQIAKTIFEIDSRLKIREVISVGSAREGTQIIRPCEYDFILILEFLSKPEAVNIVPESPDGESREYMHVKLKDNDIRSVFHEFSDNDYIRSSRWLPWKRIGLRDLFSSAVSQAVVLCSKSFVKMDTGELRLKRSKTEMNGPACTIRLKWENATNKNNTAMEISVDLCSAIKLDFEEYFRLLPTSHMAVTNGIFNNKHSDSEMMSSDNPGANDLDHTATCDSTYASNNELVLSPSCSEESKDLDRAKCTVSVLTPSRDIASNCSHHTKGIESVLLMPRDEMRFKVTFTESELQLTINLSEHHKKCYLLLKYLINGEPFPLKRHKRINTFIEYFGSTHTDFHSYMIKRVVWDHQYIQQCVQENDLGMCVTQIFSKLVKREDVMHPFNTNQFIYTSICNDKTHEHMPLLHLDDLNKIRNVYAAVYAIKYTRKDEYNYKVCHKYTNGDLPLRSILGIIVRLAIGVIVFIIFKLFYELLLRRDSETIYRLLVAFFLLLCLGFFLYMIYCRNTLYSRWTLLVKRSSICTKHIDLWLICNLLAMSLVLISVEPDETVAIFIAFIGLLSIIILLIDLKMAPFKYPPLCANLASRILNTPCTDIDNFDQL